VNRFASLFLSSDGRSVLLSEGETMQEWNNTENGARFFALSAMMFIYTPESSVIKSVSYGTVTENLYVTFKSGKEYRYPNVPIHIFLNAINAKSIGSWFNAEVKSEYEPAK